MDQGRSRNWEASDATPAKPGPAESFVGGGKGLVELRGIEPLTSAVRLQRSPI